jgi:predicted nucleic acid-binding protein
VAAHATRQIRFFEELLKRCPVGSINQAVFEAAVYIWPPLKTRGRTIGEIDILIAAYCKTYDLTLVTNNTGHFKHVSGLALADWSTAEVGRTCGSHGAGAAAGAVEKFE